MPIFATLKSTPIWFCRLRVVTRAASPHRSCWRRCLGAWRELAGFGAVLVTLPVAFSHRWPLPHALDGGEVLFEVVGAQTPHVYIKWHLLPLFPCLLRVPKAVAKSYALEQGFELELLNTPIDLESFDGSEVKSGSITHYCLLSLSTGGVHRYTRCYITSLSRWKIVIGLS